MIAGDRGEEEAQSNKTSKYEQFLDRPAMWNFSFMKAPVKGRLTAIDSDGTLKIEISRGRIILAKESAVIGVGMV